MLPKNMGRVDQVIRFIVGVVLVYFGFVDQSFIGDRLYAVLVGIFGLINLFSSFFRFCPFYQLTNLNTTGDER